MPPDPDLASAIAALRGGNPARAESLMRSIVAQHPAHAAAWLWLSAAVANLEEKRACLQKVLEIEPAHPLAQQALAQLEQPSPSLNEILAARPAVISPFFPRLGDSITPSSSC